MGSVTVGGDWFSGVHNAPTKPPQSHAQLERRPPANHRTTVSSRSPSQSAHIARPAILGHFERHQTCGSIDSNRWRVDSDTPP